jgi:mannose-1-phosphate guanylyltransferase
MNGNNKQSFSANNHFYSVILAGGGGTRLWPKSRKKTPKHLLKLTGDKTMLQLTYERILPMIPDERIMVITNKDHLKEAQIQLPNVPKENFIAEPEAKNTALAMGVASAYVKKRDEEGVIINLAADHTYKNEDKFRRIAGYALEVAAENEYLIAIGIEPTFAHTGLGYIRIGNEIKTVGAGREKSYVFKSRGFKEKPDLPTAQSFYASGQYLWNANNYVWSAKLCLEAFETHAPELYENINKIYEAIGTSNEENVLEKEYDKAENTQIDIAISEKVNNLAVIPGDFGWSDIGDWNILYEVSPKDHNKNVVIGEKLQFLSVNASNNLIEVNDKLVAIVGLSDLVVVETEDAILICHKNKTQDVKKVVEKLKEEKRGEYL